MIPYRCKKKEKEKSVSLRRELLGFLTPGSKILNHKRGSAWFTCSRVPEGGDPSRGRDQETSFSRWCHLRLRNKKPPFIWASIAELQPGSLGRRPSTRAGCRHVTWWGWGRRGGRAGQRKVLSCRALMTKPQTILQGALGLGWFPDGLNLGWEATAPPADYPVTRWGCPDTHTLTGVTLDAAAPSGQDQFPEMVLSKSFQLPNSSTERFNSFCLFVFFTSLWDLKLALFNI